MSSKAHFETERLDNLENRVLLNASTSNAERFCNFAYCHLVCKKVCCFSKANNKPDSAKKHHQPLNWMCFTVLVLLVFSCAYTLVICVHIQNSVPTKSVKFGSLHSFFVSSTSDCFYYHLKYFR